MTEKIVYFTAGTVPTGDELSDIAALNAAAAAKYKVIVMNSKIGESVNPDNRTADFVAGTVPAVAPWNALTVFDVDAEPVTIDESDTISVENSAGSNSTTADISITAGVAKAVMPSTDQIVSHGDTVVVKNSAGDVSKNATATVAAGVVSGVALASTVALVTHGDVKAGVTGSGTTATISVANGIISGIALS